MPRGGTGAGSPATVSPTVAPYGVFDAADGPLVVAVGNDDIWRRFARWPGSIPERPVAADRSG